LPLLPVGPVASSIFGPAVALWSVNAGMKAIIDALNVVYEEKKSGAL
jgi:membrane protein